MLTPSAAWSPSATPPEPTATSKAATSRRTSSPFVSHHLPDLPHLSSLPPDRLLLRNHPFKWSPNRRAIPTWSPKSFPSWPPSFSRPYPPPCPPRLPANPWLLLLRSQLLLFKLFVLFKLLHQFRVSLASPDRTTSASKPLTLTSTTISRNKKNPFVFHSISNTSGHFNF